jgi:WD40 repeat protein
MTNIKISRNFPERFYRNKDPLVLHVPKRPEKLSPLVVSVQPEINTKIARIYDITHSYPASSDTSRMIATIDKTPTYTPSTFSSSDKLSQALALHKTVRTVKPTYHAPWKLARVISGHLGWVRSVAVEPGNKWFATGAGDRVIKIWDLASGELKLSLTGHISTVRGLAVSSRHPYLFSCGEDKVRRYSSFICSQGCVYQPRH